MAKARNKTKHTDRVPSGNLRISGRLREPSRLAVRRVSDFSNSFTKQLKSNNSSLARSLAMAQGTNERFAEEIKYQKAYTTELLMQKNSEDARHEESIHRMNGLVVKGMTQIRDAVDTFIAMQEELSAMKAHRNSYRRFPSEPSQQRASGTTQTQSVGPMVQGHSILQPKVTLSRITPPLRNGGCVPAAPVPAVPAGADARASPARRLPATVAVAPEPAPDAESPAETIELFYERVRRENPLEGSSSGKRHRPFHRPPLERQSSDYEDDDDDNDDEPISTPCDRTSYSPTNMDITLGSHRLTTIFQEPSPSLNEGCPTPPPDPRFLDVVEVSPIEPTFLGFDEPGVGARDRSCEELRSPPWNGLESVGTGIKMRTTDRSTAGPSDSNEREVDNSKSDPSGVIVRNVVKSDPIGSSDITEAKTKTDPISFSKHNKAAGSESEINNAKTKNKPSGSSGDSKLKGTAKSIASSGLNGAGEPANSTSDPPSRPIRSVEGNQAKWRTETVAKNNTSPCGSNEVTKRKAEIGSSELTADHFSAFKIGNSAGEPGKSTPDSLTNPIRSIKRDQTKSATGTEPSGSSGRRRAATHPSILDISYDKEGEDPRSDPNPLIKPPRGFKPDPDWTPLSDPGCAKLRVKRKPLIKRLVNGPDVSASHQPRVLVDRMNPRVFAEALRRSNLRSPKVKEKPLGEESGGNDPMEQRALRRARPTSLKEPSLNAKMRRS